MKDNTGLDVLPYRVGVLPIPGFALMSYACTVEPLRAANLLARRPLYDIVHFADTETAPSSGAARVERTFPVGHAMDLDLLLVVAGGDPFRKDDSATLTWLRRLSRRGVTIGGVSGGSVILAAAGIMQDRRMTVHWEHASELAERYPDLLIEKRLYIIDRDRVTCGGGTAPLDLMHALISSHHGSVFARLVSDWFLHTDVRAAAAPQRAGLAERVGVHSPHVLAAVGAMEDHVADPLTLEQLAIVAGVTPRQLNRLYRGALNQSTMEYYRNLRLDVGFRLVNGSAMSISDIADATGFANPGHFSSAFSRRYQTSPSASRRAVAQ